MSKKAKSEYKLDRIDFVVLFVSLLIGAILRLIGFDWGRESIYQPDEIWMVAPAIAMASSKRLIWDTFYYPAQSFSKIQALVLMIYSNASGHEISYRSVQEYWICRIITAVAGVVTIYVIFLIGNKLKSRLGTISALILSVSPHMVCLAKQDTGDVASLFFASLTMLLALKYTEARLYRYLVLMSLTSSMAIMEKWHGGACYGMVAFIILFYSKSVKDFLFREVIALLSFLAGIVAIAPNIVPNFRTAIIDGFLGVAVYDGGQGAGWLNNLRAYLNYGYIHIGGIVLIALIIIGLLVVLAERDKRYTILLLAVIKVVILCMMNRTFPRWALELYFAEIILMAAGILWMWNMRSKLIKVITLALTVITISESISASAVVCASAYYRNQDVRAQQEDYCLQNGISNEKTKSMYYSAFCPGGIRSTGDGNMTSQDLSDILTVDESGKVYKIEEYDYVAYSTRYEKPELINTLDDMNLCVWTGEAEYPDVFGIPFWNGDSSYNDFEMVVNNASAVLDIMNGASIGAYDIYLYNISDISLIN